MQFIISLTLNIKEMKKHFKVFICLLVFILLFIRPLVLFTSPSIPSPFCSSTSFTQILRRSKTQEHHSVLEKLLVYLPGKPINKLSITFLFSFLFKRLLFSIYNSISLILTREIKYLIKYIISCKTHIRLYLQLSVFRI